MDFPQPEGPIKAYFSKNNFLKDEIFRKVWYNGEKFHKKGESSLEKYFIGEIIRQKRTELGLKQCQLCEGICEPTTMSRIESGKQMPGLNTLKNLLQRLGLSDERYYALVSKNEMQIADLQTEIVSANVFKDPQRGLPKIAELEELADPDDHLLHQFILRSKVLLGKKENGQIVAYSLEEKLDMLFKAIRLTVPNFDIDAIAEGLYSIDEAKVINQIALVYSDSGETARKSNPYLRSAFAIYQQTFSEYFAVRRSAPFGRIQLRERAGSDRTLYRRN